MMRPSFILMRRSARAATESLWVTIMMVVVRREAIFAITPRTWEAFSLSRFPVGSSASRREGVCTSPLAMAARCISPPLS